MRELSVKLERLKPEQIRKEMKLGVTEQDVLELDHNALLKDETVEMAASIDDLLCDMEDEAEKEDEIVDSTLPLKVFECPLCPQERTSLNR